MVDHGPITETETGFPIREWRNYTVPNSLVDQDLLAAGWIPFWFGLFKQPVNRYYRDGHLERFAFLSMMEYYQGKHVNLFQLGAGLGNWSMALAGIVRFKRTPGPASYRCLAVEAEPTHFEWLQECLEINGAEGIAIHGAVCEEVGTRRFMAGMDPLMHYGQHIVENDGDGIITVEAWTVDHLRRKFDFDRIHVVQMDVQGTEANVVMGCRESISLGLIDFFLIETHNAAVEAELKALLSPAHNLVIELPRNGYLELPGFSQPFRGTGAGVYLWKRKSVSA